MNPSKNIVPASGNGIRDVLSSRITKGLVSLILMLSGCAQSILTDAVVIDREHIDAKKYYMPIYGKGRNYKVVEPAQYILVVGGINENGNYVERKIHVDKYTYQRYDPNEAYP